MGYKMTGRKFLLLINDIWNDSYNQVEINKKINAARGWNLPNCKLQLYPELTDNLKITKLHKKQSFLAFNINKIQKNDDPSLSIINQVCQEQAKNGGTHSRQKN